MSSSPPRFNPDARPEVQVDTGIVAIHDLRNHTRIFGFKFLIFAACFYISIPVFYYWLNLNWTFVDSIYFCVVTFGTVGFGDIVPTTTDQRMLTSFFILIGIGVTGNLFGVVAAIRNERTKRDDFLISKLETASQMEQARKLRTSRQSVTMATNAMVRAASSFTDVFRMYFDRITLYNDMVSRTQQRDRDFHNQRNHIAQLRLKYLKELQDMRWHIFLSFVMLWTVLIFGMLVMMGLEGWDSDIAFYWAVVTISTVGFGDYVPTKTGSKVFTSFYIVVGAVMLLNALGSLVWTPIKMLSKKNEIEVIRQFECDMKEEQFNGIVAHPLFHHIPRLRSMDSRITKCEFVLTMLNLMGKVNDQDIVLAAEIFDKFDPSQAGELSSAAVQKHLEEARERDELRARNSNGADDGGGGPASDSDIVLETDTPIVSLIKETMRSALGMGMSGHGGASESRGLSQQQDEERGSSCSSSAAANKDTTPLRASSSASSGGAIRTSTIPPVAKSGSIHADDL